MKYVLGLFLLLVMESLLARNACIDLMQKEEFYEASEVCDRLAKKGDKYAQFSLGIMYYQGSGVMSDLHLAQKWLRKSAEQNHQQGQYNLGIMLANGQGSETNLIEAYAWLKISADNGYSAAMDSVKQLGEELSSTEKKAADDKINIIKKQLK
jgi:TPR repeat protein